MSTQRTNRLFVLLCFAALMIALALFQLIGPGKTANVFVKDARIAPPGVDIHTGYFTSAPVLHLSCNEANHKIYYTLDGSNPANSLAKLYEGNSILLSNEVLKDTFLYSIPTSPRWQPPLDKPYCFPV
ncbi:MAG: chitobiase/beta-hexosaminidase C-terminal domain-containing protein, partial [Bacteroidia bacterium]|nr:chitobiase/beta-hexosaminidase C-terminal domain-containing protein [Bacteroidia bacterium]